jgi:AraC-like DNA-binding protein
MGFGVSHQSVGINRCGKFMEPCRTKGPTNPTPGPSPFHEEGRTAGAGVDQKWRRITGLVGKDSARREAWFRKRGVRFLVKWIDQRVSNDRKKIERREVKKLSYLDEWGSDVSRWRRVDRSGWSVEAVCFDLGISKGRLNGLLREVMGVSAAELLDGFKIRGLKKYLVAQLRDAAMRLWERPGEFAKRRCMSPHPPAPSPFHGEGENDPPRSPLIKGGKTAAALRAPGKMGASRDAKRSKYFRTQAWEFFGLEEFEEEQLRVEELLGMLDRVREENDFRMEAFATLLGFESVGNFRKACLMVMGRTLEQLERILAREIVAFYLAAEERELRSIALREDEFGVRAREIYCGDGEKIPREPFCDRWSVWEFAKPEWLSAMMAEFGLSADG